jgi:hypothetical protein
VPDGARWIDGWIHALSVAGSEEALRGRAAGFASGGQPKERVQKLVDAYDPEKNIDAPVVIGQRFYGTDGEYQDAHGWAIGPRMDGAGKVFARVGEFSADVKKKIAELSNAGKKGESQAREDADALRHLGGTAWRRRIRAIRGASRARGRS